MKRILWILLCLIQAGISQGQVSSSCSAPESIIKRYKEDAVRLSFHRLNQYNSPYLDSFEIPYSLYDTSLKALLAVYNSGIAEADTVTRLFEVHTYEHGSFNDLRVSADSQLQWMKNLKDSVYPIGEPTLDSLFLFYGMRVKSFSEYPMFPFNSVTLEFDSLFNIPFLATHLMTKPGIDHAMATFQVGDKSEITEKVYPDSTVLIYRYGWEDCYVGCIYKRYWQFTVFPNCDVRFDSSYGADIGPCNVIPLVTVPVCDTFVSSSGKVYTSDAVFTDTLFSRLPCRIITYDLKVKKSSKSTFNHTACKSYNWLGFTYAASGIYLRKLKNTAGCDSSITLNLTIETIDTSVSVHGSTLTSNSVGTSYQWLNCTINHKPIVGATGRSFSPIVNGSFAVIVTSNNCNDTSACKLVTNTSIGNQSHFSNVNLFPNPSSGTFVIDFGQMSTVNIKICTVTGETVYEADYLENEQANITIPGAPGVYFLRLSSDNGETRMFKLLKN